MGLRYSLILRKVLVVDALPAGLSAGALVLLTTDNRLHVYDGSAWAVAF